jgi:hypothetical protein
MSSLRKHPRSPYWQAVFFLPHGRRTNRSTGTVDKKEAARTPGIFKSHNKDRNKFERYDNNGKREGKIASTAGLA